MTRPRANTALLSLAVLVTLPAAASAQAFGGSLFSFEARGPATSAGDLDGDGSRDFWVSNRPIDGSTPGEVIARSGADGRAIHTLTGSFAGDELGMALASLADADGDGIRDVAIASQRPGSPLGFDVALVSGATGATYATAQVLSGQPFTVDLLELDDVDGDGSADLGIGVPASYVYTGGHVEVISGATGASLRVIPGAASGELGASLARWPDEDGDGVGEMLAGDPENGVVRVLSPVTGATLRTFNGPANASYGATLDAAGDVDGDGIVDAVVGARYEVHPSQPGVFRSGSAYVYSGATGAQLLRVVAEPGQYRLGTYVAGFYDYDQDGHDDFVVSYDATQVGGTTFTAGFVRVHSGVDGTALRSLVSGPGTVELIDDLDADGRPDLLVAGLVTFTGGGTSRVSCDVVLPERGAPGPVCYAFATQPGGGTPEGCTPRISFEGAPSLTQGQDFAISSTEFPPGRRGFLFWSVNGQLTPFGSGHLCVAPPFVRMPRSVGRGDPSASCSGSYVQPFSKAYMLQRGLAPGMIVYAQFYAWGAAGTNGFGLSDTLVFQVWP